MLRRYFSFYLQPFLSVSIIILGIFFITQTVEARVIFSTEEGEINADSFTIDSDDSSTGNISINFGKSLNATLRYNTVSSEFEITKPLDFQNNEARNIVIHSGTSFPGTPTAGQVFYKSDEGNVYLNTTGAVGGWVNLGGATGTNAATLDNLDSLQFLRSDVADSYTGTGTLTFEAGTTLDVDDATVNLDAVTNNTLTLDSDNTGGNVTLQFGTNLNESLAWNNTASRFDLSDDLRVDGAISATGNVDIDGAATLDGNVTLGDSSSDTITINGKLNSNLDFNKFEADNMVLDKGTSFPSSPATGQKFFRTDRNQEYIYTASGWVSVNSSLGNGRVVYLAPEYPNTTLYGDGTDNSGTMEADYDGTRNFYKWKSNKTSLNDYDIVLQVRVPDDFDAWGTTPLVLTYKTDTGATANEAQIDVSIKDTTGTLEGSLSGNLNLNNNTWTSTNITGLAGTYTAGQNFYILIKPQSRYTGGVSYGAYTGEIQLNYNEK